MLENLPDALGHALRGQRAGLEKTAFQAVDLRGGMAAIALGSLSFADHAPMPARHTADGPGTSPPLHWSGIPSAAGSLVLIVEDADSPTPQPFVHAIVVGLAAADGGLEEAAMSDPQPSRDATISSSNPGLVLGRNSFLQASWLPPDPPPGHGVHRYAFQIFALEVGASFDPTPGREAVLQAIQQHGLASGCLIGTYERPDTSISEPVLAVRPIVG